MIRMITAGLLTAAAATAVYLWQGMSAALSLFLLAAIMQCTALILPKKLQRSVRYTRHARWIRIERGLLMHRDDFINRSKIQSIALRRSLIERAFGLCSVVIYTEARGTRLPGLEVKEALRIKALLEGGTRID